MNGIFNGCNLFNLRKTQEISQDFLEENNLKIDCTEKENEAVLFSKIISKNDGGKTSFICQSK